MLRVTVARLSDLLVRVQVKSDEGAAARNTLLTALEERFASTVMTRTHNSFTASYPSADVADRTAKTIDTVWGGELVRAVGDGETHIKKLMFEALITYRRDHPNVVRVNKISPIQVSVESTARIALLTQQDGVAVTGEYDVKVDGSHFVGEFIDGAWTWHLDMTGRTA